MNTITSPSPDTRSTQGMRSGVDYRSAPDGDRGGLAATTGAGESNRSAVSWAAIICGAVVASAISLALIALGAGLNLASISPWQGEGVSATTFSVMTAVWFVVIQWLSSAVGGYLTGRLRTKWVGVHTHEVFFRDTAHGFATWALASLLAAGVLSSSVASLLAGGGKVAAAVGSGAAEATSMAGPSGG